MKQKIIILLGLIATMEMTTIILFIKNQKDFNQLYNEKVSELNSARYRIERYKEKYDQNIFTENTILDNVNITASDGKIYQIKNLVKDKILIYRFSEVSCRACVDTDLEILSHLGDSIGYDNILVISKFSNIAKMNAMLNAKGFKSSCYNYDGKFGLSVERDTLTEPGFFFLLDNNLRISFVYKTDDAHNFQSSYFRRIIDYFRNGM